MGEQGYSILIWDDFGSGLVKINPKLFTDGVDLYGNPCNWWSCSKNFSADEVVNKHNINGSYHFEILWDSEETV